MLEGVRGVQAKRGTAIDRFPFPVEEAGEAPQRLADIDRDVLSFAGTESPKRCDRNGLGGQADRSHAAKPERARNDRIAAIESDFAAAVRGRHPNVLQNL